MNAEKIQKIGARIMKDDDVTGICYHHRHDDCIIDETIHWMLYMESRIGTYRPVPLKELHRMTIQCYAKYNRDRLPWSLRQRYIWQKEKEKFVEFSKRITQAS